ncbi:hypothetical protein PtA15_1A963 [Puccinia triticina]|uniref:Formin GTPase-binding domain-containing protein n=1 Tax=Puccinia triticina TaxID=208348 RepID=A0ABY7C8W8_9BASI|nr:uncharacterized protein PtA15_1A963 [Puccinia triticina]WAQ81621.1 hypothetical protein PtA15_1A963 [Puccinia triticina]WAR52509.1 hypothetical protein PtB15_1B951 [Puccinia triticina]
MAASNDPPKLSLSTIAAKLLTGVHQAPPEVARARWTQKSPLDPPRPLPAAAAPARSVAASVFAAARQERSAQRSHRPLGPAAPSIYHHRSHTEFDIGSAPAVMRRGDTQEEEELEDLALLGLLQHPIGRPQAKENEPPRERNPPRPHARHPRPSSLGPSPHPPAHPFLPHPALNSPSKPHNPMRDLYLSQVGGQDGKIESEKQRVDREFEKLLDTMQITDAVRQKMVGLDHPVKAAMLKSSTSASLMKLMSISEPVVTGRGETAVMVGEEASSKQEGSAWWAMYLKSHNFRELQAADLKKLRVALRTKPPEWSKELIGFGGYNALLKRLKELVEIEWREEQHDDQVLHEILRCFKALLLTEPGRKALASRLPDPFIQLTGLLYSEKKPGDLTTRQVLVEIIGGVFELEGYLAARPMDASKLDWAAPITLEPSPGHPSHSHDDEQAAKEPLPSAHHLLRKLIIGPPDLKKANIVDFVALTHRVRPFKTFVTEFIGVLMDYFWIFCHAENQFWDLKAIDEETIEAPKVPSGMTGGVEYEAMSYCTCLMKLLNQIIKTAASSADSKQIFQELFESGFERCLVTLRKSSVDYYPMVHLELARFIALGISHRFELPYNILKYLNGYSGHPL